MCHPIPMPALSWCSCSLVLLHMGSVHFPVTSSSSCSALQEAQLDTEGKLDSSAVQDVVSAFPVRGISCVDGEAKSPKALANSSPFRLGTKKATGNGRQLLPIGCAASNIASKASSMKSS